MSRYRLMLPLLVLATGCAGMMADMRAMSARQRYIESRTENHVYAQPVGVCQVAFRGP